MLHASETLNSSNNAQVTGLPLCSKTVRNQIQLRTSHNAFVFANSVSVGKIFPNASWRSPPLAVVYHHQLQHFRLAMFSFKATLHSTALNLMHKISLYILKGTSGIHSLTYINAGHKFSCTAQSYLYRL